MTPKMDFSKSSASFSKTLRAYADASSKGAAEAINKKAKDVCLRAIKETPKADNATIEPKLRATGTVGKPGPLVYKLIKKTGLGGKSDKKGQSTYRKAIEAKAKKFINARKRSTAYIRAGWYKASQVFGARGGKTRPGGLADKGTGSKASSKELTAIMENKAFGATKVGGDALATAMESVRKDMMVYLQKKLGGAWGKKR